MDKTDWEIIRYLNTEKSMVKVSEKLFISQPAVSYRMNKMEAEFGTSLFVRSNKGVVLTNSGERLLSYARLMMQYNEEIYQYVTNSSSSITGTITIGTTVTSLEDSLSHQIASFCEKYPQINLHVETYSTVTLKEKMGTGELMVCTIRGTKPENYASIQILDEPLIIVANEPINDDMLITRPLLRNNQGTSVVKLVDEWIEYYFDVKPQIGKITLESTSRGLVSLIKNGLGWGVVSATRYYADVDNLYYQYIYDRDGVPYRYKTYLCYHDEATNFDAYMAYIKHATAYFEHNEINALGSKTTS